MEYPRTVMFVAWDCIMLKIASQAPSVPKAHRASLLISHMAPTTWGWGWGGGEEGVGWGGGEWRVEKGGGE